MIKPTARVEFAKNSDYYVWATHTFYDTTVESLNPPILKQYRRLNIQWHNIWALILRKLTPKFPRIRIPQLAYAGIQQEPIWMKFYRFAVTIGGTIYRNDDWVSAGDAEQTGVHNTIATITIASVDATGADLLVFCGTDDVNSNTMSSTYNSASLTQLIAQTGNRISWIQYKGSPSTGSNTFVGTFGSASNGFGLITLWSGTAGTMSGGVGTQAAATSCSLSVTTTNGDVAIDSLAIGTAASAITIGAGQTQRGANTSDGWYHEYRASTEPATGTSTTMSWSWTGSANHSYTAGCIDQASAGATFTPRASFIM